MVLESLITPFGAEAKPKKMILFGFVYMTVALFLSFWVFKAESSLVMVFLATMACIPLIYNAIIGEEAKDLEGFDEKWLLKEHAKALSFFMWLFIGVTLAVAFWYTVLPSEYVSVLFKTQTQTINNMNGGVTGLAIDGSLKLFSDIFFNNVRVLIFCILFSFIYGAGAIFILNWNATVIGVAIGGFVSGGLASIGEVIGFAGMYEYFAVVTAGLTRYIIHGIPEILAYFTAGLAGGIISVAVIKHDFNTRKFEHILLDSADLLLISIGILFLAAILEVCVTPWVFVGQSCFG